MSSRQRLTFAAIAAAIAAVAVAIALAGGGGDDVAATPTPTAPAASETATSAPTPAREPATRIVIRDGQPVGGVKRIDIDKGDRVRFTVVSDTADEVHVHGFDIAQEVEAGGRVTLEFEAGITGVYEVELEDAHVPIASLRVNP